MLNAGKGLVEFRSGLVKRVGESAPRIIYSYLVVLASGSYCKFRFVCTILTIHLAFSFQSWQTGKCTHTVLTLLGHLHAISCHLSRDMGGSPRVVVSTAAFHARVRGSVPGLGGWKKQKMFLPHPRVKVSIVGSLRDREVACSASDRQGSNFESCVWKTVSSQSSHHLQEVLLAHFCVSYGAHTGVMSRDKMKWNESGFLCTYRLNWARRTSWGWWDDWDDTVLQTQDSKFEPWRSEAEHATSRSRRLPTILTFTRGWGRNIFVSFKPPRPGTEPRTLAWKAAVLTTTLGPPPVTIGNADIQQPTRIQVIKLSTYNLPSLFTFYSFLLRFH